MRTARGESLRSRATCRVMGALAVLAGLVEFALPPRPAQAQTSTPIPPPASAIGNEAVYGLAVSPTYAQDGLVAVLSVALACPSNTMCQHLWITEDGGATWHRAPADGWGGGRPAIAVDHTGHQIIFSATNALQRSDDGGDSWTTLGGIGFSTVSPKFLSDGTVALAGTGSSPDQVYRDGAGQQNVKGSSGSLWDQYFMLAPTWPSGGKYPAALLAAADPHTQYPVIQQCTADLTCSGATNLSGSQPFSAPATLLPSPDYASDGVVFAQTGRGLYKSLDGGTSFTPLTVGQPGATTTATPMMAVAPGYSEHGSARTVYAAVFQAFVQGKSSHSEGGIYKSTDGGTSWTRLDSPGPFDGGAFGVAVTPDGRLFGGYIGANGTSNAGLLCSSDGGATWQASCAAVGNHRGIIGSRHAVKASPCPTRCASPATPASGNQGGAGGPATPESGSEPQAQGDAANGVKLPSALSTRPAASSGPSKPFLPVSVAAAVLFAVASLMLFIRARKRASQSG